MKFTLASAAATFLMVGVWAFEAPKSKETSAASTTGGDRPAVVVATPKPKKKKGCLAGCFAACAGNDSHNGVGDLASETMNLAFGIIEGQEDGEISKEEARDIANNATGVTVILGDMIERFNEVRNEDLPEADEPVVEKRPRSKKPINKTSSTADENKPASTDGAAKKAPSHKKKSRTTAPVSNEKK